MTVSVLSGEAPPNHPAARREAEDFQLEWYSGTGAGGQHRNKHQNSARLKHHPTGLVVTAQCRKRPNSEAEARAEMSARLDTMLTTDGQALVNDDRAEQIGTGARADKRRTYRFQEGIVRDHLTGKSAKINQVMKGGMDRLWR